MMLRTRLKFALLEKPILVYSLIASLWWIAFNPGFFSGDSFAVINMARSNELENQWTAPWAIFIDIVTFGGSHPEFATLLTAIIFALSLAVFSRIFPKKHRAHFVGALLILTPTVGAMGVTLWHDIPMTSGFLLVVSGITRAYISQGKSLTLVFLGLCLSSFRFNGLPTILVFLLILMFTRIDKRFVSISILLTLFFIVAATLLNQNFSPAATNERSAYIGWMRNDISCYVSQHENNDFLNKVYGKKLDYSDWSSSSACGWFNTAKNYKDNSISLENGIIPAWLELSKKDPAFVLKTHLQRHAYLIPLPIFGAPSIPFIHTTIETQNQGIAFTYPKVAEVMRYYPRIWNYFNFFFGYAGLWLAITFYFAWAKKNSTYSQIGLVGLISSLVLFVFADIPDGRYMLFTLVTGQCIFLYELSGPCIRGFAKIRERFRGFQ
jgi:hypothetical protein